MEKGKGGKGNKTDMEVRWNGKGRGIIERYGEKKGKKRDVE